MATSRIVVVAACVLCASSTTATAGPKTDRPPPPAPRIFHAPTAWLQPAGNIYGSMGANHRASGLLALAVGIGDIAEFDVNMSDRFQYCTAGCTDEREVEAAWAASALFKVGVSEDVIVRGQPAVALGFRKSFHMRELNAVGEARFAELYAVVGKSFATAAIHVGAQLFDFELDERRLLSMGRVRDKVRPMIGATWRPPQYPATTVLVDFSYVPEVQVEAGSNTVELRWIAGWGVRYQALSWGSVELGVRHRAEEGLPDSTVFLRLNGVLSVRDGLRK